MKKSFNNIFIALMAFTILFYGCKEDDSMSHTNVSEVTNLYGPANGNNVFLGGNGTVVFEWEQAKAEDNGVVLYEVLFDKPEGDFSKPLYSIPSDGKGLQRMLSMSYADLTKVASAAGIAPSATGKVKWTVWSSKGINVKRSSTSRELNLERPEGFPAPASAFLTGTATEGGEDLSKAVAFRKVSDGVFELYTSLTNGSYRITERNSGNPTSYSINAGGKLVENGSTDVTTAKKPYRIRVNFNNATTEISEVVSVGLWFAPDNRIWFDLPYTSGSSWEIKNAPVVFKQEGWGRDERYKFRFTIKNAAGVTTEEWFGSTKGDNQRPTASTEAAYWYMVPVSNDRWNNSFKFNGDVDNKNADIKVTFNSAAYTHSVTVK
ncbi:SusE domain-containing protein [Desertivirga brevis]|uniref:SusE domain-containing protein n=1 Tax=Desertivirga brevis TaxID=2810310 RepID=UPI001A966776|nr:SusE domain-containing protein [Pedobacter sp. SYSU D00873]